MTDAPELSRRCELKHHGFALLGDPVFRRAEGSGVPVVVSHLGAQLVSLPLRSLAREFGITPDMPDHRMLDLIAQALDYVVALKIGDPLPAEILTGDASWEPSPLHRQLASARLQLHLVRWLAGAGAAEEGPLTPQMLLASVEDPGVRPKVQHALREAAARLEVADGEAVAARVEDLAHELAYIEALRERLHSRVEALEGRLRGAERAVSDRGRRDMLIQARRLTGQALVQINARFEEVDAQTGEVLPALKNMDGQRSFIRSHRDWLYRSHCAWSPVLEAWDAYAGTQADMAFWALIERTYHFVAPRFMAFQAWRRLGEPSPAGETLRTAMAW